MQKWRMKEVLRKLKPEFLETIVISYYMESPKSVIKCPPNSKIYIQPTNDLNMSIKTPKKQAEKHKPKVLVIHVVMIISESCK